MPPARRPPPTRASRTRAGFQGRREPRRSDLLSRILFAVPAAIVAIIFIDLGGLAFALFMIALGWVCQHELYGMLTRWKPVAVVGFASLGGMVLAARYGTLRDVFEVGVATVPVLFLFVIARGDGRATVSIAGTLLGVYWIGFAFAHAE